MECFCYCAEGGHCGHAGLGRWNLSVADKAAFWKGKERILRRVCRNSAQKVYPGTANFLLFYEDSIDWYAALLKQKILIRDCSDYAGLSKGFYRIAIRRREENQVLVETMQAVKKGEKVRWK